MQPLLNIFPYSFLFTFGQGSLNLPTQKHKWCVMNKREYTLSASNMWRRNKSMGCKCDLVVPRQKTDFWAVPYEQCGPQLGSNVVSKLEMLDCNQAFFKVSDPNLDKENKHKRCYKVAALFDCFIDCFIGACKANYWPNMFLWAVSLCWMVWQKGSARPHRECGCLTGKFAEKGHCTSSATVLWQKSSKNIGDLHQSFYEKILLMKNGKGRVRQLVCIY